MSIMNKPNRFTAIAWANMQDKLAEYNRHSLTDKDRHIAIDNWYDACDNVLIPIPAADRHTEKWDNRRKEEDA